MLLRRTPSPCAPMLSTRQSKRYSCNYWCSYFALTHKTMAFALKSQGTGCLEPNKDWVVNWRCDRRIQKAY